MTVAEPEVAHPRVAIGVPLYNGGRHLPEAIESLLSQTYRDFALILTDDCSSDDTPQVIERYARLDRRIVYERNEQRLGMTGNYRKAFRRARELHPQIEYFAWGSDHDVWHPRWLEELVARLDASPNVVLTYPLNVAISEDEGIVARLPWYFDTAGIDRRLDRLKHCYKDMSAGNMVYGLFRVQALERCGVYRSVLLPDRLLMSELSLLGEFHQVPEILWMRRLKMPIRATLKRQRRSFFPGRAPLSSYLSWAIVHPPIFFWAVVVRGGDGAGPPRAEAARLALLFAAMNLRRRLLRAKSSLARRTLPLRQRVRRGRRRLRLRKAWKHVRRFLSRRRWLRAAVMRVRSLRGARTPALPPASDG